MGRTFSSSNSCWKILSVDRHYEHASFFSHLCQMSSSRPEKDHLNICMSVVAATFPKPKLSSLSYLFIHLETLHMLQYLYQGGPINVPYLAKRFSWIQLYRNYMSKNRFLPPTLLPGPGLLVTYFRSRYFFVTGLFCVAAFCAEMAALLPILEH